MIGGRLTEGQAAHGFSQSEKQVEMTPSHAINPINEAFTATGRHSDRKQGNFGLGFPSFPF